MTARPCRQCGELITAGSYCTEHTPKHSGSPNVSHPAYGNPTRWKRLSKRLRRIQPWCSTCGSTEQLTIDHLTPVARGGAPYDLDNLDVLCRPCNSRKGNRAADPGGSPPDRPRADAAGEAKTRSHTGMIPEKEVQDHARRPEGDAGQQPAAIPPTQ